MAILSSPLNVWTTTPPVTRGWTLGTVVLTLLYYWLRWQGITQYMPLLTLIPGSSIFYPWTFVTSGLVETTIPEFIFTIVIIPPSLRYFERLWGSIEIIKFIVVTFLFSNIIAFGFNWIEFLAIRNADLFLYGMEYHGQMALQTGILVAFTQIIPEHQIQILGVLRARVKTLPMAYLTFSTVIVFLGFQCPYIIIQFAWLVSWVYLRFYKKNTGDVGGVTYGDRSETFALVHWFPPFAHYPISVLGNTVYTIATRFHLIPSGGPDLESGTYAPLPGGARAEAERRRAMALKALDQRLANTATPAQNSPSQGQPSRASPPAPVSRTDSSSTQSERKAGGNENGDAKTDNP